MEKIKILLAEDDLNLGTLLKEFLEVKNFSVTHCFNGDEGGKLFEPGKYDLLILDVMMPKKDGFSLAKEIRKADESVPIIFLTAKSMQNDKIEGLKLGADDYMTKPFSTEELLLRISAILKRTKAQKSQEARVNGDQFKLGIFRFDYTRRILHSEKGEQKLTGKEADLLKLLCQNKNDILERSFALKLIWKEDNYFTARSMDVYITKLRNYLSCDQSIQIINIHGTGFKLIG
ncbi:MAG: response regulator transcription factor [bacterium]